VKDERYMSKNDERKRKKRGMVEERKKHKR
jgi:hypothetical protein